MKCQSLSLVYVFATARPMYNVPLLRRINCQSCRTGPRNGKDRVHYRLATFMPGGKADAMVMGDMVLFEDEVNPVMSAAVDQAPMAPFMGLTSWEDDLV